MMRQKISVFFDRLSAFFAHSADNLLHFPKPAVYPGRKIPVYADIIFSKVTLKCLAIERLCNNVIKCILTTIYVCSCRTVALRKKIVLEILVSSSVEFIDYICWRI